MDKALTDPLKYPKIAKVEQDIEAVIKNNHITRSSMDDI